MQLLTKDPLLQINTMMLSRGPCLPHLCTNKYKYNYKYKIMKIRVSPTHLTLCHAKCLQARHSDSEKCLKSTFNFLDSVTNKVSQMLVED